MDTEDMTLGKIISELEKYPIDSHVAFDFADLIPASLSSWRGDYSELAIVPDESGRLNTVGRLLARLREAVGETFTGYKGGDFVMHNDTRVWVSNYGRSSNTAIVNITANGNYVTLHTGTREY